MVPKGWERKTLDEISDVIDCKHRTPKYVKNGIPLVSPGTIKWGAIDLESPTKRVTAEEYESLMDHCTVEYGDLVLSRNQSVGIASFVDSDKPFVLGQDTVLVKPKGSDPRFLFYNLQSTDTQKTIFKLAGGSTFSRINLGDIRKLKTIYPPLAEQQKIAKILSTWDKAISTTERLIDNSTQQKKALMQQLLTGKKRLLDELGKPFEDEWNWVNLEDICDVKGGKRLPKGSALSEVKTFNPYIRVADMYMGGVDLSNIKYVPESVAPLIKNYTISKDDLFITVAGTLGIVGSIPDELDGANLTENADKLTNIKCDKTFLLYVMTSSIIQRYIDAESTQNAQPKLALVRIRGFKVPLPKPEEQQKIATVLTNADKEIELLEQQLADLQQEKKALMQVLLPGKKRVVVDGE
tara:strand:+ start:563 stop:1789 length:1227 start_codon:yes stop_codon:yes gene_type:complete